MIYNETRQYVQYSGLIEKKGKIIRHLCIELLKTHSEFVNGKNLPVISKIVMCLISMANCL